MIYLFSFLPPSLPFLCLRFVCISGRWILSVGDIMMYPLAWDDDFGLDDSYSDPVVHGSGKLLVKYSALKVFISFSYLFGWLYFIINIHFWWFRRYLAEVVLFVWSHGPWVVEGLFLPLGSWPGWNVGLMLDFLAGTRGKWGRYSIVICLKWLRQIKR